MVALETDRPTGEGVTFRSRHTFFRRWIAPGAAALAVLLVGGAAWPYTVDDAFITGRYARHLAHGLGYVMNPGGPPTDAVTGPLWLVPMVLGEWIGLGPIRMAKWVGLACMAAAVGIAIARVQARAGGRCARGAALAVVCTSPALGTWGVAGLETALATLVFTVAWWGATARPRPYPLLVGNAIGALAWLRPELALASGALWVALALRDRRAGLVALGPAVVGAAAIVAFRLVVFGDFLPLALHAKPGPLANGLSYTLRGVLLATSVVGVLLCAYAVRRGRRDDRATGAVLLVHVVAVVLAGGDWMPGVRLFVPLLPLYAVLVGVGVSRAWRRPRLRAVAPLALGLACLVPAVDLAVRVPELHGAGASRQQSGRELARWLRAHAQRAALVDVGYLAYASGIEVVDLGGLTDAEVARMPGGHLSKQVDEAWLKARAPDVIVLHTRVRPERSDAGEFLAFDGFPVEARVAAMPWVRDAFSVAHVATYAPDYHYVVLKR